MPRCLKCRGNTLITRPPVRCKSPTPARDGKGSADSITTMVRRAAPIIPFCVWVGSPLPPGLPPGVTQLTQGSVITNSVAAYFDTTWNLTSRLNMDVGARWNEDQKKANVYVSELY